MIKNRIRTSEDQGIADDSHRDCLGSAGK